MEVVCPPAAGQCLCDPVRASCMGSDQRVYVSDRQVDMDGRIYLLESAIVGTDDVRPAYELGISPRDEDGDVDLWLAGDEAFERSLIATSTSAPARVSIPGNRVDDLADPALGNGRDGLRVE